MRFFTRSAAVEKEKARREKLRQRRPNDHPSKPQTTPNAFTASIVASLPNSSSATVGSVSGHERMSDVWRRRRRLAGRFSTSRRHSVAFPTTLPRRSAFWSGGRGGRPRDRLCCSSTALSSSSESSGTGPFRHDARRSIATCGSFRSALRSAPYRPCWRSARGGLLRVIISEATDQACR
jgi:hypothetical protein